MARRSRGSRFGTGATRSVRVANGDRFRDELVEDWLMAGDPLPRPLPPIHVTRAVEHEVFRDAGPQADASRSFDFWYTPLQNASESPRTRSNYGTPRTLMGKYYAGVERFKPILDPIGCLKRHVRSEVLHALGIAGKKGLGRGGVKRKIESDYSC